MRLADSYHALDLDPGVSPAEVKQAHRDLTKVWHPDRFAHDPALRLKAEEKLKSINEAYAAIRESFEGAWPDEPEDADEPAAWRVRSRGRESRFVDLESIALYVERGALREDAEVRDPAAKEWAPLSTIPRLRAPLAQARMRRNRRRAITCAVFALLILLRRPTPGGLVIALALGVASAVFVYRMRIHD